MKLGSFDQQTLEVIGKCIPGFDQDNAGTIEAISKFNWLWPCFEATKCNQSANRDSLDKFAEQEATISKFGDNDYNATAQYFLDRYRNEAWRLDHLCPDEARHKKDREAIEAGAKANSDNQSKSIALVRIVYRLRNNLFHGTKGNEGIGGQNANFVEANKLLIHWTTY